LDSSVYNKIAAGEVVERPSSVVKELVENAIDAGANDITVEITDGGIKSVRVSDDGIGIDETNLKKAFLPHATSKILNAEDLFTISSLGFRGEALPSIASVSVVEITSKPDGQDAARRMEIKGGAFGKIEYAAANRGTSITINDLFYNTKPRLNFLKRAKTEESYISSLMTRFILAYPELSFTYKADGKIIYKTDGGGLKNAVYEVYGKEISDNLIELRHTEGAYRVSGFISAPGFYKPNKSYQTLFVNGRIVENLTVSTAALKAYGENIMKRCFPIFILDLILPFDGVDVNAHPTKNDVRFRDERAVFAFVYRAVKNAVDYAVKNPQAERLVISDDGRGGVFDTAKPIGGETAQAQRGDDDKSGGKTAEYDAEPVGKADGRVSYKAAPLNIESLKNLGRNDGGGFSSYRRSISQNALNENTSPFVTPPYLFENQGGDRQTPADKPQKPPDGRIQSDAYDRQAAAAEINFFDESDGGAFDFVGGRLVGQVLNCYIIFEYTGQMYVVDQHAAHERINYDRLKARDRSANAQIFMQPYIFSLNHAEAEIIEGLKEYLNGLGFEIDGFGGNDYKISAAPIDIDIKKFIDGLLSEIKDIRRDGDFLEEKIIQTACKSSIKSGDSFNDLQLAEFVKLLRQKSAGLAPTCPHGRPIFITFSKNQLDKMFKRIL
jgi:DNA mismatch repair protein MutL